MALLSLMFPLWVNVSSPQMPEFAFVRIISDALVKDPEIGPFALVTLTELATTDCTTRSVTRPPCQKRRERGKEWEANLEAHRHIRSRDIQLLKVDVLRQVREDMFELAKPCLERVQRALSALGRNRHVNKDVERRPICMIIRVCMRHLCISHISIVSKRP